MEAGWLVGFLLTGGKPAARYLGVVSAEGRESEAALVLFHAFG